MDEFRKPFEYTEEKRGFLLIFIFMIVSIDILLALAYIIQLYDHFKQIPVLRICFIVISILYLLTIPFTFMTCYNLKKYLVTVSKAYLIIRTVFFVGCITIKFLYDVQHVNTYIGNRYRSITEFTSMELIAPLVFELAFSIGWYLYFLYSKRCKEIVNKTANL